MLRSVLISLLSCWLLCSCAVGSASTTALLQYEEFGPPSMSSEMLGTDWWQWQEHGESRPQTYDIKVVVYRHLSLEDVKKKYQVSPQQRKDYRYVEYAEAVRYLDDQIKENALASLTARLQETKAKIIQQLGVQ